MQHMKLAPVFVLSAALFRQTQMEHHVHQHLYSSWWEA